MHNLKALIAATAIIGVTNAASLFCRCQPGQSCWPTTDNWSSLNSSIGGNLAAVLPIGLSCHDPTYNAAACATQQANTHSSEYRSSQLGTDPVPQFSPDYPNYVFIMNLINHRRSSVGELGSVARKKRAMLPRICTLITLRPG
jgi:hypothetical protein